MGEVSGIGMIGPFQFSIGWPEGYPIVNATRFETWENAVVWLRNQPDQSSWFSTLFTRSADRCRRTLFMVAANGRRFRSYCGTHRPGARRRRRTRDRKLCARPRGI